MADALHYAHSNGVVHRDIKPENILLANGRPVVADFGIALAVSAAAGGRMTETGLSLGTPHYMSPEQATAEKEIDARSDIYSLASVLYEMLAGQPPHLGGSAQQIIMKIIAEQPATLTSLRRSVPANVSAAIGKALEKLPADRFSNAAAFAAALADPHFGSSISGAAVSGMPGSGTSRRLTIALAGALAVVTGVAAWAHTRSPEPPPVARYAMAFPQNAMPAPDGFVLLTSDGSDMVYVGPSDDGRADSQLWLKRRESARPTPLAGTGAAWAGAISPDDRSVAFVAGSFLRRMELSGSTSTLVTSGVSNRAGSVAWLDDRTMLYTATDGAIMQVDENGGTPRRVWASDSITPEGLAPLPDARGFLFRGCSAPCNTPDL